MKQSQPRKARSKLKELINVKLEPTNSKEETKAVEVAPVKVEQPAAQVVKEERRSVEPEKQLKKETAAVVKKEE